MRPSPTGTSKWLFPTLAEEVSLPKEGRIEAGVGRCQRSRGTAFITILEVCFYDY